MKEERKWKSIPGRENGTANSTINSTPVWTLEDGKKASVTGLERLREREVREEGVGSRGGRS